MSDEALLDIVDSFQHARVLVFGDVMLDRFIYGSIERMSPEAPVPVMTIERMADMPGGAANVARNVAALGAHAVLLGVVGGDEAAVKLREQLAETPSIGVRLIEDGSRPTTLKTRHMVDRQQMLRTDVESRVPISGETVVAALAQFRAALATTDIVILSDYGKGALSDAVTAEAIGAARQAGKHVLVDPKSRSFLKYAGATVLTPNRQELQSASGRECCSDEQVVAASSEILGQGICSTIVVTRGKDGMTFVSADGSVGHIRTIASEVFEVTGAGDTAVAAMAVGLAGGAEMSTVVRLANMAAGIVVGKQGTATVTAGEIISRLAGEEYHPPATRFSLDSVRRLAGHWRALGLRIAFTNGCFDLLHPGHISLLNQAKQTADRLIVGLNSDASVRRLKGAGRPVQTSAARATVLTSLRAVDAVVIFEEDTPLALIDALEPDVLVKGADYTVESVVGADRVLRRGGKVVLAELVPAQSTTSTINRIAVAGKA